MSRMKSLFRSGGSGRGREKRELPRDVSDRSLAQYGEVKSPEPLLQPAVFTSTKLSLSRSPSAVSEFRQSQLDFSSVAEGEDSGYSRYASTASVGSRMGRDTVSCKLCFSDISIREMYQLQQCLCHFCKSVSIVPVSYSLL